jgi:hypothetical protein
LTVKYFEKQEFGGSCGISIIPAIQEAEEEDHKFKASTSKVVSQKQNKGA